MYHTPEQLKKLELDARARVAETNKPVVLQIDPTRLKFFLPHSPLLHPSSTSFVLQQANKFLKQPSVRFNDFSSPSSSIKKSKSKKQIVEEFQAKFDELKADNNLYRVSKQGMDKRLELWELQEEMASQKLVLGKTMSANFMHKVTDLAYAVV